MAHVEIDEVVPPPVVVAGTAWSFVWSTVIATILLLVLVTMGIGEGWFTGRSVVVLGPFVVLWLAGTVLGFRQVSTVMRADVDAVTVGGPGSTWVVPMVDVERFVPLSSDLGGAKPNWSGGSSACARGRWSTATIGWPAGS